MLDNLLIAKMKQLEGSKILDCGEEQLIEFAKEFPKLVMDLGCGDGKFAYNYALKNPNTLVLAIDSDKRQMERVSYKASRKPAKGGLNNVKYIWSSVENLPKEISGLADKVFINFPWGSLLAGTIKAQPEFLEVFSRLLRPDGELYILTTYSTKYEPQTVAQLGLPQLSLDYVCSTMSQEYARYNLQLQNTELVSQELSIDSYGTWPKRLVKGSRDREVYSILFKSISSI